jgi:hypothetical protein
MTIEAQEKIMELREMLLDLREQNSDLWQENSELKDKLAERTSLVFENDVYWATKEGGLKDGPFCPSCRDKDGKLCRMSKQQYVFHCLSCHLDVFHTEPPPPKITRLDNGPFRRGAW